MYGQESVFRREEQGVFDVRKEGGNFTRALFVEQLISIFQPRRFFSVYIFDIVSIVWSMLSMVLVCICKTVLVPSFVSVSE